MSVKSLLVKVFLRLDKIVVCEAPNEGSLVSLLGVPRGLELAGTLGHASALKGPEQRYRGTEAAVVGVPLDRMAVDLLTVLLHQVHVIVHHLVVQRSAVSVEGFGDALGFLELLIFCAQLGHFYLHLGDLFHLLFRGFGLFGLVHGSKL